MNTTNTMNNLRLPYAERIAKGRNKLAAFNARGLKLRSANNNTNLIDLVNEATKELNAQYTVNMKNWANEKLQAVVNFKAENRVMARKNTSEYYDQLFAIAGGKTWYNVLTSSDIEAKVIKHCNSVIESRNNAITKKLTGLEVTSIETITSDLSNGGFEGNYKLVTDQGVKTVTISIIVAGGYNVQCIHNRTLVKVK